MPKRNVSGIGNARWFSIFWPLAVVPVIVIVLVPPSIYPLTENQAQLIPPGFNVPPVTLRTLPAKLTVHSAVCSGTIESAKSWGNM